MGTISGCRYLKVNLRQKFINMLTLLFKGVPTKLLKFFWLKIFSFAMTPVVNLELRICLRIFEKIRNGPNGILRGWGKLIHEKNQKSKISWHCPFKTKVLLASKHLYMGLTFGTEKAMGRNPRPVSLNSQPDNPKHVQMTLIKYYQYLKHIY